MIMADGNWATPIIPSSKVNSIINKYVLLGSQIHLFGAKYAQLLNSFKKFDEINMPWSNRLLQTFPMNVSLALISIEHLYLIIHELMINRSE